MEGFYPDLVEATPRNMLEPLVNPVTIRAYVDANHAVNLVNSSYRSGLIIYVKNSLLICYTKRQNTVESSSFVSDVVAIRVAT